MLKNMELNIETQYKPDNLYIYKYIGNKAVVCSLQKQNEKNSRNINRSNKKKTTILKINFSVKKKCKT